MLELCIGVSAEDGLGEALGFVAEDGGVVTDLAVAEDDAHATALVGLGLAEDADTGAVFLQSLVEVIVEQGTVNGCFCLIWV